MLFNENNKPKILLMGMPHADSSFFEMNIGQPPQGPEVTALDKFPSFIRRKANGYFNTIFNPVKKTPYMGLRLIEQNLKEYINFALKEYPENDEEIVNYVRKHKDLNIIGMSIGCENRVYEAKSLCKKIRDLRPDINIVFGNYGAVAGKKLGILTEKEGEVLWDSEEERELKKSQNKDFYSGEGIHDMKLWLKDNGLFSGDPHAPLISASIPDRDQAPSNPWVKWCAEKIGFIPMTNDANKIGVSIGCTNNCSFCNTRFKFNRSKTFLYRKAEEIFHVMEEVFETNLAKNDFPPEAIFFLMDENFMKDETVNSGIGKINFLEVAEKLCTLIMESGKNIRWGTFSDVKSLLHYKKKHTSYHGLVRGGLQSVWIGLESKEDVFDKRGKASTEEVEELIRELQSLGITIIGSFIPGLDIHTEEKSLKIYDTLRAFMYDFENSDPTKTNHWFENKKDKLFYVIKQLFRDNSKSDIIPFYHEQNGVNKNPQKSGFIDLYTTSDNLTDQLFDQNKSDLIIDFRLFVEFNKEDLSFIFKKMVKNDKYERLNIWEDIDWWIKQNTACRQVMMYSITGVVGNHDFMVNLSDYDFGHMSIPGFNKSYIPGNRLEKIDREARKMFYQKNGPVTLTSLLTFWDGFMNLKNSENPSDIVASTYYYWMAKRYLHQISLASFFFNDKIFTKCSDQFLNRLATMYKEIEDNHPVPSDLHAKYQSVFNIYDGKVTSFFKKLGDTMRERFIKKHLLKSS